MGIEVLAHIGIPFLVAFALVLFRAAAREKRIGLEDCNEMAFEMAILGIGATGGIFVNPTLIRHYGEKNAVYGITVVLATLVISSFLIYRSKFRDTKTGTLSAMFDIFFGSLCIAIPAWVIYNAR